MTFLNFQVPQLYPLMCNTTSQASTDNALACLKVQFELMR
jgi:hypothetical protein